MLRTLPHIAALTLFTAIAAWADIANGDVILWDDQTSLVIVNGPGEREIALVVRTPEVSREITLSRESDSIFTQSVSLVRVNEIRFFDATRIWITAHLSPNVGGAFLFDLNTEEYLAELLGYQFQISPSGRHVVGPLIFPHDVASP